MLILTNEFPPFPGGIATYVSELAAGAAAIGHEVVVYAADFNGRDLPRADDTGSSVEVRRFRGDLYRARDFPRVLRTTLGATLRNRWDVIHFAEWPFALAARYARLERRAELIATVYGTEVLGLPASRQLRVLGLKHPYPAGSRLCPISEYTRRLLLSTWPSLKRHPINVTTLGVSRWWLDGVGKDELELVDRRLAREPDDLVVTTIARLVERKGHLRVIGALGALRKDLRRRVIYAVAGTAEDEAYVASLERLASDVGVRLVQCGVLARSAVRSLLSRTDIFAMPGVPVPGAVEGYGLAYLEAGAQGVPSIATNLGGAAEAVIAGETGLVIPCGSQDALNGAIAKLLEDGAERDRLGRNARAHAEASPWSSVARATYG